MTTAASLTDQIAGIAESFSGILGVAAKNLTTGEVFGYNASEKFAPASTIKLPVLVEVYRQIAAGNFMLDDTLPLEPELTVTDGGVLDGFTMGHRYPIRDLAHLMITISDNSATNHLIKLVGAQAVNAFLDSCGLHDTRLNRYVGLNMESGPLGQATPADMARLLELLATDAIITPWACKAILGHMQKQLYHNLTTRYIDEWDEELEPEEQVVRIACKSGWVRGVRHDLAVVWAQRATYVLAMYSKDCADRSYKIDNEAAITLPKVSQVIYDSWGRAAK